MGTSNAALRQTFAVSTMRRSAVAAIVVGTILTAIDQGPEMLHGGHAVLWKMALTYTVPFLVASYDSYTAFRAAER